MTARGVLRRAKGVSQRLVRKIAHGKGEGAGALFINSHPALFRDRVKEGDEIRLIFPDEKSWIEPEDTPLTVLYEDDDILVIDKQPGIVVHPTKGHREGTIAGAIVHHMLSRGESYKPRFISRLDMDTSGVLLVGKNSHAQDNLAKQGMAGGVQKYYIAVLDGRLEDDLPASGIIDLPIGLERPGEPRRTVISECEGGYPSQTEYEVLRYSGSQPKYFGDLFNRLPNKSEKISVRAEDLFSRLPNKSRELPVHAADDNAITVVKARLITGRTHQIRVHFAHYGHPVLGDSLYGRPTELISRQALHAAEIEFTHPQTEKAIKIEAPIPADMAVLW